MTDKYQVALQKPSHGLFSCYGDSWGLSFSLGKIAVENGAKPFGVAQFQVMFAGIILLFITVIRKINSAYER